MHLKLHIKLEPCQMFILCKFSMHVYIYNICCVLFLQKEALIANLVHFIRTIMHLELVG